MRTIAGDTGRNNPHTLQELRDNIHHEINLISKKQIAARVSKFVGEM